MNSATGFQIFIEACRVNRVSIAVEEESSLSPASSVRVSDPGQWSSAVQMAKDNGFRWTAFWSSELSSIEYEAFSCLENNGQYLLLRTRFEQAVELPSIASIYPAADRPERHAHDMLGIRFKEQPDSRRWTRHRAWPDNVFPLQAQFANLSITGISPADDNYPFHFAHGAGVVEIPVGPVHAGIIEPGHFRFQAIGETVLNLEERLGYVHKGIEKIAVGRDTKELARLAGRVSGDSTVAHTWAACQAMERACCVTVPPRALYIRAIMAERERIANHLGDIGAICNDVAFTFAYYQFSRIKEELLRANDSAFGHRYMMDNIMPGGVKSDISGKDIETMVEQCYRIKEEVSSLITIFESSETLEDRLMTTGRLTPEQAHMLGAVGYVGKASAQKFDVRRDSAYEPYDNLTVQVPTYHAGDVAARAKIRADEIGLSVDLILELVSSLPEDTIMTEWPAVQSGSMEGIGFIEGWRGEIITYVKLDSDGRVLRFYPRDPSWLIWPALEILIQDNIVPDFPVCNKSVNGSYSGQDL